jgi:DNA-binding LacI/PurR family transcriptional regulator
VSTIREVARRAGVSLATASRALNDSPAVAPDTARAVHAAALALRFRPNRLGRNLRAKRSQVLGVMLPTLQHPVFADCLASIEQSARGMGCSLALATTGYDPALEESASELLLQHRVDGLILTVASASNSRLLDKLDAEQVPYVLVYNQCPGNAAAAHRRLTVSVDNRAAAASMTEYLLALGHQRIVMLCGQFRESDRAQLRFAGYADAMTQAGLPPAPALELPFMTRDTRPALASLMSGHNRPSALFCASDQLALLVIRDLAAMGLNVGHDVSVAGFDGVQIGEWVMPALTTVVQPNAQIGSGAAALLQRRLDGHTGDAATLLPHTLRAGATAALWNEPPAG